MSNEKLDLILNELKQLNERMGNMEHKQDTVTKRMESMEHKQDTVTKRMENMEHKQDTVTKRMENMEHKQDTITQQVVKNTEGITAVQMEQQAMKAVVTEIKTTVAEMKPLVEQIPAIKQAVLETHHDVKALDKLVDHLSRRSLEHEIDITELRRIR